MKTKNGRERTPRKVERRKKQSDGCSCNNTTGSQHLALSRDAVFAAVLTAIAAAAVVVLFAAAPWLAENVAVAVKSASPRSNSCDDVSINNTGTNVLVGDVNAAAGVKQQHRQQLQRQFERWFADNGGWMHPDVLLESDIAGYGKGLAVGAGANDSNSSGNNNTVIRRGQPILRVPERLVLSKRRAIELIVASNFGGDLDEGDSSSGTSRHNQNSAKATGPATIFLLQQMLGDLEAMALLLAIFEDQEEDCANGQQHIPPFAFFAPYLNMIRLADNEELPLLHTFENSALQMLGDDDLIDLARSTAKRLERTWDGLRTNALFGEDDNDDSGSSLKFCGLLPQFRSFRRYYGVVSSHAMILQGVPHLVPMADMINHRPRNQHSSNHGGSEDIAPNGASFADYHYRDADTGAIVILSDRTTASTTEAIASSSLRQQVFEEYAPLDNSLYLASFGFVPDDNPYHCVALPFADLVAEQRHQQQPMLRLLRNATLQRVLERIHPEPWRNDNAVGPTFCIRRDFSVMDNGDGIMGMYASIVVLEEFDAGSINDLGEEEWLRNLRSDCITAYETLVDNKKKGDVVDVLREACYVPNATSTRSWRAAVGRAATARLAEATPPAVSDDPRQRNGGDLDGLDRQRLQQVELAMRFRDEDEKVLRALVGA